MAALVLDDGLDGLERSQLGTAGGLIPAQVRLYTAIAPALSKSSVNANFVEAAGMGYARATISGVSWGYVLDTTLHRITATCNVAFVFGAGAGMTILGYYVMLSDFANVCFAEQFGAPVVILPGGGSLAITINDMFKDCTS